MTPKTLRRKLQKKCKRRHYGKCPRCGNRTEKRVESVESNHPQGFLPRLVIECKWSGKPSCGWKQELTWTGKAG